MFTAIATSWLPSEVQTIQHKQGMQPPPGAEEPLQCTWLISQEQGNLKMQLYFLYNNLYRDLEMAVAKHFFSPAPAAHTPLLS